MSDLPPPPPTTAGSSLQSSLSASLATAKIDDTSSKDESVQAAAPAPAAGAFGGGPMTFDFKPFASGDSANNNADEEESDDEDYCPQPGNNNLGAAEMDVPACVLHRIDFLQRLHDKKEGIEEEYQVARAKIEAEYNAKYKDLYDERKSVVTGELEDKINEENGGEGDDESEKVVGCPQFWIVAMGHMDIISEAITETDVDALEYVEERSDIHKYCRFATFINLRFATTILLRLITSLLASTLVKTLNSFS